MKTKSITGKIIVVAALCFAMVLTLCSCGSKTAASVDDFKSKAKSLGLEIEDVDSEKDYIKSSCCALKPNVSDDNWFIGFYVAESKKDAEEMYNYNESEFSQGVSKNVVSKSGDNYKTYHAEKDGKYLYVGYVDDTMLCAEVDLKYKDDAEKLIDDLGY